MRRPAEEVAEHTRSEHADVPVTFDVPIERVRGVENA